MPMLRRLPETLAGRSASRRVNTVICGLSTPSVPPDITKAMRCSTSYGVRPSRGASAVHSAATAYSRVKSLTPPLPSVLPRTARMDFGSIAPEPIKAMRPETSPGPLVAILMTPTDVVRILVLVWALGARQVNQPWNRGACQAASVSSHRHLEVRAMRGVAPHGSHLRDEGACILVEARETPPPPRMWRDRIASTKKSSVDGCAPHLDESTSVGP